MFRSSLSKDFEDQVRKRHEVSIRKMAEMAGGKIFRFGGFKLEVLPRCFPPYKDSFMLARLLSHTKNLGRVLDIGTGSGILALAAAKNAESVLAVDINPDALMSARINAKLNGVEKIKVRRSDLFSNAHGKFDTILFNAPFRYFRPRNMAERAVTDHNYKTLTKFFREAKKHLKKGGRIFLIFSSSGDLKYLSSLIRKNGLRSRIVAKADAPRWGVDRKLYYYVYLITKI